MYTAIPSKHKNELEKSANISIIILLTPPLFIIITFVKLRGQPLNRLLSYLLLKNKEKEKQKIERKSQKRRNFLITNELLTFSDIWIQFLRKHNFYRRLNMQPSIHPYSEMLFQPCGPMRTRRSSHNALRLLSSSATRRIPGLGVVRVTWLLCGGGGGRVWVGGGGVNWADLGKRYSGSGVSR